jgi:hypothetical protein
VFPYKLLIFVLQYLIAAACFPVIGRSGLVGRLGSGAFALVIALAPGLLPPHTRVLRFLAAACAITLVAKLYDVRFDLLRKRSLGFRHYLVFLANPFVIVRRRLADEPQLDPRADLRRLAAAIAGLAAGFLIGRQIFWFDWREWPLLIEHTAKVVGFYAVALPVLSLGTSVWRLCVGPARDVMDRPYLALTPADFWRRYNRNMNQFFVEDLLKPMHGRRSLTTNVLLVFAVSAVLHEYVFGVATGRVEGYQTAFFLLQGVAVAATAGVKPRGWSAVVWTIATAVFVLISSTLFFASMQGVAPFYSRPIRGWQASEPSPQVLDGVALPGDHVEKVIMDAVNLDALDVNLLDHRRLALQLIDRPRGELLVARGQGEPETGLDFLEL